MHPPQLLYRFPLHERFCCLPETDTPGMQHESVKRMQVAPAGFGGAPTEVVFLAVALAEILDVEQADRIQAVAADVHAKADTGRHIDDLARVGGGEQGIEPGGIAPGRQSFGSQKRG